MRVPQLETQPRVEIALSRLGLIDYNQAWALQRTIHDEVVQGTRPNTLLLLEHPSVFTAGRRTEDSDRPTNGAEVIEVDRGGRITWHGPGQLVGYPIVKLKNPTELVGFVREMESCLIQVCADLGVSTVRIKGRSGVWIQDSRGDRKIAAIGVRVTKGVTMHGFALNVNPDLSAFSQIVPCGIQDADVTSLEIELERKITIDEIMSLVEHNMGISLNKVRK
jgi:lipoyl(octanoyl) transferase